MQLFIFTSKNLISSFSESFSFSCDNNCSSSPFILSLLMSLVHLNEWLYRNYYQVETSLKYHWPLFGYFQCEVSFAKTSSATTSFKQSESKQNKTLNLTTQATKQPRNVSNSETNQNLHQITLIFPLFFIKFSQPSSGATCKSQQNKQAKIQWQQDLFFVPY